MDSTLPLFAAGVILSGRGYPSLAHIIADIPQWVFHGTLDVLVSVSYSRDMVNALKVAGGNPIYTEYQDKGHAIAYDTFLNLDLHAWLFKQSKADLINPIVTANGVESRITISNKTPVSIKITLEPGDFTGHNADWVVVVNTSTSWFHLGIQDGKYTWLPGIGVIHQGC